MIESHVRNRKVRAWPGRADKEIASKEKRQGSSGSKYPKLDRKTELLSETDLAPSPPPSPTHLTHNSPRLSPERWANLTKLTN
ncbi:hypothetical protein J6590_034095 [Homalodisca vitripennis]|nr:hypothetical protein J6590_034095 [Homalodisca vitripennis]